ncbi:hypothetical protein D3C85_1103910 [compost metagenome]
MLADLVVQLTGEGPLADAGRIGLHDAQHIADAARPDARARRRLTGHGVGRRHIGIGAVVHVQEGALRPLEQHALAVLLGLIQHAPGRLHIGQDLRRDLQQLRQQGRRVDRLQPQTRTQGIVVRTQTLDLDLQVVFVGQIADADGATAHLVLIGRADAAAGRADLGARRAGGGFARHVQGRMDRQDQTGVVGDGQDVGADGHALGDDLLDLADQMPGIDDHAVADDRGLALHHARRQQRQLVNLAVDDQRMARVMAALEAHHHVGAIGQPVHNLALALVAPLGADYRDVRQDRFSAIQNAVGAYNP